ncbi:MAG: hypothetical protein HYV35_05890 [Lentisphaerae bacterium]|nr:hypothetical protein [Lentisphaerota bacterium]
MLYAQTLIATDWIGLTNGGLTFSRCITDNTEPPITMADGRHSVNVVLAIYEAIRKRKVVKVRE